MERRLKRPRDPLALAKLIGDIATGRIEDKTDDGKKPAGVDLGRLGGKGGKTRAARMTPEERRESAKKAVQARWAKKASS